MCSFVFVSACLILLLPFVWISAFFFFFLSSLYCHDKRLMGSWFTNQKLGLSLWVGVLSPGHWTTRVLLTPSSIIGENSHKSLHLNPRPSITQLSEAPSAGCLTQRISKTGTQSQAAAGRLPIDTPTHTTSHGPAQSAGKNSPPLARMRAQVPPNMKLTQATGPTSPTRGRDGKQEL